MKIFKAPRFDSVDGDAVLTETCRQVVHHANLPTRRAFLQRSLMLDGLSLLTDCSISDNEQVEAALSRIPRLNNKVQGLAFDPSQLIPAYPDSMTMCLFSFNAYYDEDEVRQIDGQAWRPETTGLISDRRQWNLADLRTM